MSEELKRLEEKVDSLTEMVEDLGGRLESLGKILVMDVMSPVIITDGSVIIKPQATFTFNGHGTFSFTKNDLASVKDSLGQVHRKASNNWLLEVPVTAQTKVTFKQINGIVIVDTGNANVMYDSNEITVNSDVDDISGVKFDDGGGGGPRKIAHVKKKCIELNFR
jgi:hypothetical protein